MDRSWAEVPPVRDCDKRDVVGIEKAQAQSVRAEAVRFASHFHLAVAELHGLHGSCVCFVSCDAIGQ